MLFSGKTSNVTSQKRVFLCQNKFQKNLKISIEFLSGYFIIIVTITN